MTEPHQIRKPTKVGSGLARLMDARKGGQPLRLPESKAEFERLVTIAERDLRPARRGRPAHGQRGAITRTRSIRAPDSLWRRIEALAKRRGVSVNQAAVLALESLTA